MAIITAARRLQRRRMRRRHARRALRHRGRRARGLRVRAQRGPGPGRADQRWARSFVVANALRVKSGHLRLAPLFTLLNHGEDGLRPTELEDGALRLEAARDLRPGDDVRINYGHGSPRRWRAPLRMVPVDGSDRIRRL